MSYPKSAWSTRDFDSCHQKSVCVCVLLFSEGLFRVGLKGITRKVGRSESLS